MPTVRVQHLMARTARRPLQFVSVQPEKYTGDTASAARPFTAWQTNSYFGTRAKGGPCLALLTVELVVASQGEVAGPTRPRGTEMPPQPPRDGTRATPHGRPARRNSQLVCAQPETHRQHGDCGSLRVKQIRVG